MGNNIKKPQGVSKRAGYIQTPSPPPIFVGEPGLQQIDEYLKVWKDTGKEIPPDKEALLRIRCVEEEVKFYKKTMLSDRNALCVCGSGKKRKKCCANTNNHNVILYLLDKYRSKGYLFTTKEIADRRKQEKELENPELKEKTKG